MTVVVLAVEGLGGLSDLFQDIYMRIGLLHETIFPHLQPINTTNKRKYSKPTES